MTGEKPAGRFLPAFSDKTMAEPVAEVARRTPKPRRPKPAAKVVAEEAPAEIDAIDPAAEATQKPADLAPYRDGEPTTCPMCRRKHRGVGLYCSSRCEERGAIPADLHVRHLRSLYCKDRDPLGRKAGKGVARPGNV